MDRSTRPLGALQVCLALACAACGGGGGGGGAGGSVLSGLVLTPAGQGIPTPLPGLAPVPDGTPVELVRLDGAGGVVATLDDDTTSAGRYSFDLDALGVDLASDLAVQAGGGATRMRAWAVESSVDVDPVSEALLQLALQQGVGLAPFTLDEARDLGTAVRLLAAAQGLVAQGDIDATVALVRQAVQSDAGLAAFLLAAAAPGQTSVGPGDVGDYFPLERTNSWRLAGLHAFPGGVASYLHDERVLDVTAGVATVLGVNALGEGDSIEDYYSEDDRALTFLGNDDAGDPLTAAVVPYDLLRFPLRAGDKFVQFDVDGYPIDDLDGDGKQDYADFRSVSKLAAFEDLAVAAGDFAHCARFESTLSTEFSLSSGIPASGSAVETLWLAPRRGPVRAETVLKITVAGQKTTETYDEELIGFQVGGEGRGIVPSFELVLDVSPANSDTETPGRPGVAFDGTNHLVVTVRDEQPVDRLVGALIDGQGEVLDEFTLVQGTSPMFGEPCVAFDGTNYLVVYGNDADVRGVRVSPNGTVLDPGGFAISTSGSSNLGPAVAYGGGGYLVAWRHWDNVLAGDVYAARVTPGGAVSGEIVVFAGPGDQLDPELAFDGANHAIVWRDDAGGLAAIRGAHVTPAGVVFGGFDVITGAASGLFAPQLCFDGQSHLVVWQQLLSPAGETRILGRRHAIDGTPLDASPFTIVDAGLPSGALAVGFDATNWIVAWDLRDYDDGGIHARRVTPGGVLLDGAATTLGLTVDVPSAFAERFVHPIFAAGDGKLLLVWVRNSELGGTFKDVLATFVYPF